MKEVAALVIAAVAASFFLSAIVANPWYRMATLGMVLTALAAVLVPIPWRTVLAPTRRTLLQGVGAAVFLYVAGAAVFLALLHSEPAARQIHALYAWREAVPRAAVWPLLVLIVTMEELVWRLAVTLPLARRYGPWTGAVLGAAAFALAHVAMGVPMLVFAALAAGAFWGLLVVYTGSAVPALVSHLLWDAAVLLVWPYPDVLS